MEKKFAETAYQNYLLWGIVSSMSVTLCTIIDAALIGRFIGSTGLAIAGIATPVYMLYAFFGVTLAVGANVLIGRSLGAADKEAANRQMGKQLFLGLSLGLFFFAVSLIFQNDIVVFLGARDALFSQAKDYLMPVFISSPFFVLYQILSMSVRTDGNSRLAAIASGLVISVNLILDILLMGYFDWGVQGASLSLCIAEVLGVLLLLTHFGRKLSILKLSLTLPKLADLSQFIQNGFGVGSAYIFQALIMLIFNKMLLSDAANGVIYAAIYGVLYTISTIPTAFFDGAANAFAPVVSIFVGEQDTRSIMTVYRLGIKFTAVVSLVFCGITMLFPAPMLAFFGIDADSLAVAVPALRWFAISFLFTGFNMLFTAFWQTIGRAHLAGIMSILRNFAVILLFGIILIPHFHIAGLAMAHIACEALCFAMAISVLMIYSSKKYVASHYSPTGRVFEKYYSISTESVGDISADIELLCEEWEILPKQAFFMNFIAEEILLNIIKFGMEDGEGRHYIDIKLLEGDGSYTLRIRDDVKAYDPFASDGDEIDNGVLQVIRKRTKVCDYQRKLIFNYLYLII